MRNYDLIQVLWVEDDGSIINQYKKDAYLSLMPNVSITVIVQIVLWFFYVKL